MRTPARARVRGPRLGAIGVGLLLVAAIAGCAPGVRWRFGSFQDVHPRARAQNKLTFVYFRSWYSVDCTDFEERVLKDPLVLLETLTMVCVPLDFDYDHPLAQQWQIKKVPAYAIVAPDGKVLVKTQAPITRDRLLDDIRSAKNWFAAAGRATTAPAPSPP